MKTDDGNVDECDDDDDTVEHESRKDKRAKAKLHNLRQKEKDDNAARTVYVGNVPKDAPKKVPG